MSLLYFQIGISQKWISGNTRLTFLPKVLVTYAIFFIDPRENKAYLKNAKHKKIIIMTLTVSNNFGLIVEN